jgi:ATP phosphoribosyltransferase regulatory subunit
MLAGLSGKDTAQVIANTGPAIGLRTIGEIATRIDILHDEAATAPIKETEYDLLQDLFAMSCSTAEALPQLRQLSEGHELLADAVDIFAERTAALSDKGIDTKSLPFVGNYGRTSMEYYDGFVFGFSVADRVVATGGRYDALTSVLGQGRAIAAVGGVIRPDELLAIGGHA